MGFEEAYIIDDNKYSDILKLIEELSEKYKIDFKDHINNFTDLVIREFNNKKDNPHKYTNAHQFIEFCDLKGDARIKTDGKTITINREVLLRIQELIINEKTRILANPIFFNETNAEKESLLKEWCSKEGKKEFKEALNGIVRWLKGNNIFANIKKNGEEYKNMKDNDGAFLYDLFYNMKDVYDFNLTFEWKDDPTILVSSDKRKIICNYIDK